MMLTCVEETSFPLWTETKRRKWGEKNEKEERGEERRRERKIKQSKTKQNKIKDLAEARQELSRIKN